ncbi:response regulator transcription factor [Methylobacterium sp. AMS5]|uniref:response regulator transcription factor n=1 Tax=Methylobacterium sp. AMS5 TaxID=925818 RepID=UPI00074F9607|nr:response regulator transcription factor [Methylobacterium sp. AMS5]AMB43739.1 transcriptional regulator [Methylobacterium sp. AMS5]
MYIVVDEQQSVTDHYVAGFGAEGVKAQGLAIGSMKDWLDAAPRIDVEAIDGFLIGDCADRASCTVAIRSLSRAPIIALNETRSLEQTLALFTVGIDDVVRKPVHVREIIARATAIRRRTGRGVEPAPAPDRAGRLKVYTDGRDPEIDGACLILPRRERHILEYLSKNRGRQVTKGQIFTAVYGDLDTSVEESVVEGHISKLRKKLRMRLGYDPIEAKRMAGYTFVG